MTSALDTRACVVCHKLRGLAREFDATSYDCRAESKSKTARHTHGPWDFQVFAPLASRSPRESGSAGVAHSSATRDAASESLVYLPRHETPTFSLESIDKTSAECKQTMLSHYCVASRGCFRARRAGDHSAREAGTRVGQQWAVIDAWCGVCASSVALHQGAGTAVEKPPSSTPTPTEIKSPDDSSASTPLYATRFRDTTGYDTLGNDHYFPPSLTQASPAPSLALASSP